MRVTSLAGAPLNTTFRIGRWRVEPNACTLSRAKHKVSLEPKVMDLLVALAAKRGEVLSKQTLFQTLWPNATVGEDTLARAVSKLRRALGDKPKAPRYIETIPKRGYRLTAALTSRGKTAPAAIWHRILATTVLLAAGVIVTLSQQRSQQRSQASEHAALTARADDYYMRFTRAENEAAIELYQQVIAQAPANATAQAGLANALVQRVVRWPEVPSAGSQSLTKAIGTGQTQTATARAVLERALALASQAVQLAPHNRQALKALGLVYTARGQFDQAMTVYEQAIGADADAWEAMINLGEIHLMHHREEAALQSFQQAYRAMQRAYAHEPQRVGPWQPALGVLIGTLYETNGQLEQALDWYRAVLATRPFEPTATGRLVRATVGTSNQSEARRLCRQFLSRIGPLSECTTVL